MNTLQITPIPGFKGPSVSTASPVGEAPSAPSDSKRDRARPDAPAPVFNANGQSLSQQIASARPDVGDATDDLPAKDAKDVDKVDAKKPDKAESAAPQRTYDLKIGYA